MRLSISTVFAAAISHVTAAQRAPQWIVIGTNGQLLDVDPLPYLPDSRRLRKLQEQQDAQARHATTARPSRMVTVDQALQHTKDASDDGFFDDDDDEPMNARVNDAENDLQSEPSVPDIETLLIARDNADLDAWGDDIEDDEDEAEEEVELARIVPNGVETAPPTTFIAGPLTALEDESSYPAVQGSVMFAELSCVFVSFITYLVYSISLWPSFSMGQKACLSVAFSAACLYQIVALGWYYNLISPDVTLGISSLITRTISLGMVPITTTSFLGRARTPEDFAIAQEKPVRTKPSGRRKARSS